MEKMVALKAKKKRKRGDVPHSADHAFFVCGKNRNNQIYWPIFRELQTKSTRKMKKKNVLKLKKKVFGGTVVFSGSFSPSKCLTLHSCLHCGLCGETTFLSYTMVTGGGELWGWVLGRILGDMHDTKISVITTDSGRVMFILISWD